MILGRNSQKRRVYTCQDSGLLIAYEQLLSPTGIGYEKMAVTSRLPSKCNLLCPDLVVIRQIPSLVVCM